MSHTALVAAAFIAATLLLVTGCRSGPRLEPGAGLVILADSPAGEALVASDFFRAEPVEAIYEVVAGEHAGSQRSFRRTLTDKFSANVADEYENARTEFLRLDEGGSVVMTAVIDVANKALTRFDPPLVVMPAQLQPGEVFASEASMRVLDAQNPSKEKERGSARRTVEYVGDRVLRTPFGEVHCHQLRVMFKADLRLADAETRSTLYIAREYGLVAEQWSESIKMLGALASEKGEVMLLVTEPR